MQDPRGGRQDDVTPPGSLVASPSKPLSTDPQPTKQVLKILDTLRRRRDGRQTSECPWDAYKIRREEFDELISRLNQEESLRAYFEDRTRYDYDSYRETLILRMRSYTHEVFLARVVVEILAKLRVFTDTECPLKAFAQNIRYYGSCTLNLQHGGEDGQSIIRREPDAMFQHCDARWPALIIEVSYSQKAKDLPRLADDYILETNGSVHVVIGLDIDYKNKEGTISIWRPSYVRNEQGQLELEATQTLDNQVFRDECGSPNLSPDAGLKLELKDFAPDKRADDIPDSLCIDSATLCQFLNEAEHEERKSKQGLGVEEHLRPGAKKRRREKTPPEQITSDDERKIADDKRRVERRQSEDNSSYKSPQ